MLKTGLVSVTFRKMEPASIVDLVAHAGLDAIEWGGDVHVPHGEVLTARAVHQMTLDAGLSTPSYGSYYRVGHPASASFAAVIETAVALGTPVIRVWAGMRGSQEANEAYRQSVVEDSRRIADEAEKAGLVIAYEFHANTLTDTYASALDLLHAVAHDDVRTYWQPPAGASIEENVTGIKRLQPWLANIHVTGTRLVDAKSERHPLSEMEDAWTRYLRVISHSDRDHYALLEFVRGDTPEQFLEDAESLKQWVEPYHPKLPLVP